MGAEISEEQKLKRNRLAFAVTLGHTIKHIFMSSLPLLLSMLKVDPRFSINATQYGIIAAADKGAAGATTMVAGYLGERYAHKSGALLFLSLSLMGIAYFFLGNAASFLWIVIIMLLAGIGPALYHPPAIASLSRKFPDRRGFAISLHGMGGAIGSMLGPVLIGILTIESFDSDIISIGKLFNLSWDQILKISVIPAIFFAILVYLLMKNIPVVQTKTESIRDYFGDLKKLLKDKQMMGLISVTGLRAFSQSSIMYFLPLYLIADPLDGGLGKNTLTAGMFLSGAQVIGVFTQPVLGWASDRYSRKQVLLPSMGVLSICFFTLTFASDGYQLILNIIVMGAFLYSLHAIFIAAAMDVAKGEAQSTVVSLIYGASFIGSMSPIFAGMIVDEFGLKYAFSYCGVIALISTIIFGLLKLPSKSNDIPN